MNKSFQCTVRSADPAKVAADSVLWLSSTRPEVCRREVRQPCRCTPSPAHIDPPSCFFDRPTDPLQHHLSPFLVTLEHRELNRTASFLERVRTPRESQLFFGKPGNGDVLGVGRPKIPHLQHEANLLRQRDLLLSLLLLDEVQEPLAAEEHGWNREDRIKSRQGPRSPDAKLPLLLVDQVGRSPHRRRGR